MQFYERLAVPPSYWNFDHKRFYTSARLVQEIESSLPRASYQLAHLRERFNLSDLGRPPAEHAVGPYEIECVIEKTVPNGIY